jgi:glycyl-tRNA synthetase beta chain
VKEARPVPLLVEIGCEEIPARFLSESTREFGARIEAALTAARLLVGEGGGEGTVRPFDFAHGGEPVEPLRSPSLPSSRVRGIRDSEPSGTVSAVEGNVAASTLAVQAYSTPRRLIVFAPELLPVQPDQVEEINGPPVRVAFDAEGKPTRAAESFAEKYQVPVQDLLRKSTPKGEYLAVRRTVAGRPALELLKEILPAATLGLSWPKSMVWVGKQSFVRPIRWILALLGEGNSARVVPFEIAGVRAGNRTFGHRSYSRRPIPVADFKDYLKKLAKARVEIDPEARRSRIKTQVKVLLEKLKRTTVEDRELEDWTVNSTEWPRPILGEFDPRFLALPREILVAVMRGHQKYFAVEDSKGNLQAQFVAIVNVEGDPKGLIRAGHERVLAARFADAEFFWNADQKVPLRDRLPMLERVTYQAKLGSYADKVRRMETTVRSITSLWADEQRLTSDRVEVAIRAARLSKADLTTQMVQEFTELQGIVGGLYASAQGEPAEVADAIYDHYRPVTVEDQPPRSLIGCALSLSDKIDAVAAGFAVGLAPTGSSDPFGLRRQANGVVKTLFCREISINLKPLIRGSINGLNMPDLHLHTTRAKQIIEAAVEFFQERVTFFLESVDGLPYDVVRAALAAPDSPNVWYAIGDNPLNIGTRATECNKIRGDTRFLRLSAAAKRVRNILTKSAEGAGALGENFSDDLLQKDEERELARALSRVESRARVLASNQKFGEALLAIAELSEPLDRFFDSVMVMVEDVTLRENRLRLLNRLNGTCSAIVDFSQIVVEGDANPEGSKPTSVAN